AAPTHLSAELEEHRVLPKLLCERVRGCLGCGGLPSPYIAMKYNQGITIQQRIDQSDMLSVMLLAPRLKAILVDEQAQILVHSLVARLKPDEPLGLRREESVRK